MWARLQTYILGLSLCLVGIVAVAGQASSDPGPHARWLMLRPISAFSLGIFRSEQLLEEILKKNQMRGTISSRYSAQNNRLIFDIYAVGLKKSDENCSTVLSVIRSGVGINTKTGILSTNLLGSKIAEQFLPIFDFQDLIENVRPADQLMKEIDSMVYLTVYLEGAMACYIQLISPIVENAKN